MGVFIFLFRISPTIPFETKVVGLYPLIAGGAVTNVVLNSKNGRKKLIKVDQRHNEQLK